jgi:hypothetical protein
MCLCLCVFVSIGENPITVSWLAYLAVCWAYVALVWFVFVRVFGSTRHPAEGEFEWHSAGVGPARMPSVCIPACHAHCAYVYIVYSPLRDLLTELIIQLSFARETNCR